MISKRKKAKLWQMKLIRTADAKALGITSSHLAYYAKQGKLERLGRGVYRNPKLDLDLSGQWEDLVAQVLSIPHGVVTGISALALYNVTDEIAREHWIAVPNNTTIGERPDVRIMRLRNYKLGISKIKVGEVEIPIYDLERTLVEAFRFYDPETYIKALKMAFALPYHQRPNVQKLARYCRKLRCNMHPYLMTVLT